MEGTASAVVALQILACVVANVNAMRAATLERRTIQTSAICSKDFVWADTSKKESPCLVAANTMALCRDDWTIYALKSNEMYDPPNSTTANICSCSWTVYNLLSACADCQGVPQAVKDWPFYSRQCPGVYLGNDTFFPSSLLNSGVLIPAWATTDPSLWSGRQYNTAQAKSIAQEEKPDVGEVDNVTTAHNKSPVGAIAGGAIGGFVALGIAAGIVYFLRKHRKQTRKASVEPTSEKGHMRGPSDSTVASLGYASYISSGLVPGYSNGAPTIRTHVTSVGNSSVLSGQPARGTIYVTPPSPPPTAYRATPPNPENGIVPFTLQCSPGDLSPPPLGRKSPHGPGTKYASPNTPPAMCGDALFDTPTRPRINPPAYSVQDNTTPSSSHPALVQARRRQGHAHNNSDADPFRAGGSSSIPEDASDIFTTRPDDAGSVIAGTPLTGVGPGAAKAPCTSPSYPRDVKRRS